MHLFTEFSKLYTSPKKWIEDKMLETDDKYIIDMFVFVFKLVNLIFFNIKFKLKYIVLNTFLLKLNII